MRRTSFFGALAVIAVGGVLAFAVQSSPKQIDLHVTGLIIMLAGIADLVIRTALGSSPLLPQETADVAAVVEPLGEPVLDVFGNPITPTPVRVLRPPPPGSFVPIGSYEPLVPAGDDGSGAESPESADTEPVNGATPTADDTQDMTVIPDRPMEVIQPEGPTRPPATHEEPASHDQVVRQTGEYEPPASLTPVYALTGRPVKVGRRRRRRRR